MNKFFTKNQIIDSVIINIDSKFHLRNLYLLSTDIYFV